MRYFAVILSMIILAFSTTTCSDELLMQVSQNSCQVDNAGTHQQEHMDFCSPFCACACCAAQVIPAVAYFTPVPTIHSIFTFCETPAGVVSDVPQAVWQPPQA